MSIEVMKQALDWFTCYQQKSMSVNNAEALAEEVVAALRRAIEQAKQEPWCMKRNGCKTKCEDCPDEAAEQAQPVAWMNKHGACMSAVFKEVDATAGEYTVPLYTAPPQHMTIEVMKQALEALEECALALDWVGFGDCRYLEVMRETGEYTVETTPAITALRQAIAEAEQAQPLMNEQIMDLCAAEREACAKLLDEMAERDKLSNYYAVAARAIRERKQDPMPLFDDWNKDWK